MGEPKDPNKKDWIHSQITVAKKREFRILCATEGVSMSQKIAELVDDYLDAELEG